MTTNTTWPVGASLLRRLFIGFRSLTILKYEPDHPVHGPLFGWCLDQGTNQRLVSELTEGEDGARILATRPTLQGPDLDLAALSALPNGTLGREFARYFERNGIHPFLTTFEITTDDVFIAKRYRETHDLLHVITGYPTHMLGEMELQAFVLGNLRLPSAAMILFFSFGIRFGLCGLRELGGYVQRLRAAWRRGQRSRMMLGIDFERHWARPLREVAAEWCAPAEPVPELTAGVHLPPRTATT